jgi:hypothetical protein
MCVGVSVAAVVSDPQVIGAFANCLFQILQWEAPVVA